VDHRGSRLDDQTPTAKAPAGVAALAHRHGKRVLAFAGSVAPHAALEKVFDATCGIVDEPVPLETRCSAALNSWSAPATAPPRIFQLSQRH